MILCLLCCKIMIVLTYDRKWRLDLANLLQFPIFSVDYFELFMHLPSCKVYVLSFGVRNL